VPVAYRSEASITQVSRSQATGIEFASSAGLFLAHLRHPAMSVLRSLSEEKRK